MGRRHATLERQGRGHHRRRRRHRRGDRGAVRRGRCPRRRCWTSTPAARRLPQRIRDRGGAALFVADGHLQGGRRARRDRSAAERRTAASTSWSTTPRCSSSRASRRRRRSGARSLDVNVVGTALISRYAAAVMKQTGGGAIVNLASISSFVAQPHFITYSATKAALVQMTRCMALDLAPDNIRVNCVCPGTIRTAATDRHMAQTGMTEAAVPRRERPPASAQPRRPAARSRVRHPLPRLGRSLVHHRRVADGRRRLHRSLRPAVGVMSMICSPLGRCDPGMEGVRRFAREVMPAFR